MDWFIRVVQGKFIGPRAEYQIDKRKNDVFRLGLFFDLFLADCKRRESVGNTKFDKQDWKVRRM